MILLVDFHAYFWLLPSKRAHLKGSSAKMGTSTDNFGRADAPSAPPSPEGLRNFIYELAQELPYDLKFGKYEI